MECHTWRSPETLSIHCDTILPPPRAAAVPALQVRAVSARAMGSLLKGMGSECFSELVPWLMATLRSDAGNVERRGAAQVWMDDLKGCEQGVGGGSVDGPQGMGR